MDEITVKTQIRLPADLHRKLTEAADRAGRSFNNEMVTRLEKSFPAAVEDELLQARKRELVRLKEHADSINYQIAQLTHDWNTPSKKHNKGQIHEAIALLSKRQMDLKRIIERTEEEILTLSEEITAPNLGVD